MKMTLHLMTNKREKERFVVLARYWKNDNSSCFWYTNSFNCKSSFVHVQVTHNKYIIWARFSIGYMSHSYTFTFFLPLHTVIIIINWWRVVFNSSTFSKCISLNITGIDKFVFIVSTISGVLVPFRCISCRFGIRVSFLCFVSPLVYHAAVCFNMTILCVL